MSDLEAKAHKILRSWATGFSRLMYDDRAERNRLHRGGLKRESRCKREEKRENR
jgi:hypothetical protein